MSKNPEHHSITHLFALIDGLDEDRSNWEAVRELKLTAHTVAKDLEDRA